MPLLLVAVPLQKSWLGLSYWRTPSVMELPVELEYISYEEFEERFAKLNKIAKPIYPTIWPNVCMVLIFGILVAVAGVGMARNNSGMAVMGQVSCFVIPILAILWIRIRKEAKARARKQFKRRSVKLLREWSERDTTAFAIQWKLRLRVWNDVRRRREAAAAEAGAEQVHDREQEEDVDITQEHRQLQSVTIQVDPLDNTTNTGDETTHLQTPDTPTIQHPSRVADVYTALRLPMPPSYITSDTITTATTASTTIITPDSSLTTPSRNQIRMPQQPNNESTHLTSDPLVFETRRSWIEQLRDLSSRLFFTETRVWMIEISKRENTLDEYTLTVPSPVYCGYRLPGYEDVLLSPPQNQQSQQSGRRSSGNQMAIDNIPGQGYGQQIRYTGPPPSYFSDSEDDDDDDEDDDDDLESRSGHTLSANPIISNNNGSTSPTEDVATRDTQERQQSVEMTTVTVSSGPVICNNASIINEPDRIGGHPEDHRRNHHHLLREQQGSTMSGSTAMTTPTCSVTTSRTTLALTLADKEDPSFTTDKHESK